MHQLGFFIFPDFQLLDLAGPSGVFEAVARASEHPAYNMMVISPQGGPIRSSGGVMVDSIPAATVNSLDTLIACGGALEPMCQPPSIQSFSELAARSKRLASVCTGAFLLAEAGLLDGHRVTTHWHAAPRLQQAYPAIKVEPDRIYIEDQQIWSSAGITAGIDLALAMVERDHGSEVSHQVARELVVYHRRSGGQSQFSPLSELEPRSDRIRELLSFIQAHLAEPLPVERLAEQMHLSVRQFSRFFRQQTGESPARAVERLRAEAAHVYITEQQTPIAQIAQFVGFSDAESMRRAFVRIYGLSPQAIRRAEASKT